MTDGSSTQYSYILIGSYAMIYVINFCDGELVMGLQHMNMIIHIEERNGPLD
jgi:hypothetical protein